MNNESVYFEEIEKELMNTMKQMTPEARARILIDQYFGLQDVSDNLRGLFFEWLCQPSDSLVKERILEEKFCEVMDRV